MEPVALGRLIFWDRIANSIWPSGSDPRQQAEHMIAVDPRIKILFEALEPKGPSTHRCRIGMRLQHLKQTAGGLSADHPARVVAKAVIVEEVERLHWRLWNGNPKDRNSASIVSVR